MNSDETESSLLIRRMVSAMISATDSWRMRGTGGGVITQRNGVGDDQCIEVRVVQAVDRRAGQYRVGTVGDDLLGAICLQRGGGLAQRAGGVDHVVHDDAGAAVDLADDVHDFGHVGLRAALVDDGQVAFEALGQRTGAHHTAVVRGNDHRVFVMLFLDIFKQDGQGVDVVDRDVEEALDLFGVQVHGQYAVDAGGGQHVGDQLGGDRHP